MKEPQCRSRRLQGLQDHAALHGGQVEWQAVRGLLRWDDSAGVLELLHWGRRRRGHEHGRGRSGPDVEQRLERQAGNHHRVREHR